MYNKVTPKHLVAIPYAKQGLATNQRKQQYALMEASQLHSISTDAILWKANCAYNGKHSCNMILPCDMY